MSRKWAEDDPPASRLPWSTRKRWTVFLVALVADGLIIQGGLVLLRDHSPVVLKARGEVGPTMPVPPTEDPGITACREVAERMERVQAGGAPASDAERARARALLAASAHAELREVAARLDATKDGNLYEQAEASGELLGACSAVGIRAGLGY